MAKRQIEFNDDDWQWALDKQIANIPKPVEGEPEIEPPTLDEYCQARVDDVGNSYARQREAETESDPDYKPAFDALRRVSDKTKLAKLIEDIEAAAGRKASGPQNK